MAIAKSFRKRRLVLTRPKGVPALAWRFANNQPVKKAEGGYWLRSAS